MKTPLEETVIPNFYKILKYVRNPSNVNVDFLWGDTAEAHFNELYFQQYNINNNIQVSIITNKILIHRWVFFMNQIQPIP